MDVKTSVHHTGRYIENIVSVIGNALTVALSQHDEFLLPQLDGMNLENIWFQFRTPQPTTLCAKQLSWCRNLIASSHIMTTRIVHQNRHVRFFLGKGKKRFKKFYIYANKPTIPEFSRKKFNALTKLSRHYAKISSKQSVSKVGRYFSDIMFYI